MGAFATSDGFTNDPASNCIPFPPYFHSAVRNTATALRNNV